MSFPRVMEPLDNDGEEKLSEISNELVGLNEL